MKSITIRLWQNLPLNFLIFTEMKRKVVFLYSFIAVLVTLFLPMRSTGAVTFQDDRKKEGKKKPDVKEVPKSRKQSKPGKPGKG